MEVTQRLRTEAGEKKQVLHCFKEDVEEAVEEAFSLHRGSAKSPTAGAGAAGNAIVSPAAEKVATIATAAGVVSVSVEGDKKKVEKTSEDIAYFDKNEGSGLEWSHSDGKVEESKHIKIDPVLPVISGKPVGLLTSTSPQLQEETDERAEVEEIEVEFERAVEEIHTHGDGNMYCPHCRERITKVVLRRKFRPVRIPTPEQTPTPDQTRCDDLYGCLSCLRIFFRSEPLTTKPGSDFKGDVRIPLGDTPPTVAPSDSSRSLEIVKSFVYGGLMESITSLSVVSSAAASDATTLSIVALGLSNLVGGLVILAHNLRDLRYGDSSEASENRYKEHLGRKEHFLLHATLAVLSYLVFGLIPPVIYGFTFRASDDRDYKILAVAAASLLCIVILAIAKAYTRGEHKFMAYFKTILYYVVSAVMVSGIAYAVGDLVNRLLERLGWLNPSTVEPQPFSQAKLLNPTSLASY